MEMNLTADLTRLAPELPADTEVQQPKLHVSVIGGARFSYGGQEIELRNRKACAIFGYLALTQAGEEQREKLAGLFWSEFSEQNARATLRQAIHEFREVLQKAGCSALVGTRTALVPAIVCCVAAVRRPIGPSLVVTGTVTAVQVIECEAVMHDHEIG